MFEAFSSDFTSESNVEDMGEDERMYEAVISIRVLAYLVGDASIKRSQQSSDEECGGDKIPRERTMLGEDDFDLL